MTKTLKLSGKMKTISTAKPQTIEEVLNQKFGIEMALNALANEDFELEHFETRVRFIEFMGDNNAVSELFTSMFYVVVKVNTPMDVPALIKMAKVLDMWCTMTNSSWIGDYEYVMGDGDDASAVLFENGQFRIWLRARKTQ